MAPKKVFGVGIPVAGLIVLGLLLVAGRMALTRLPGTAQPVARSGDKLAADPLSIEYLRGLDVSDSRLTIEEELTAQPGYASYIASYPSEGLRIYGLLTVPEGEAPETGWPAIVFCHGNIPPESYRTTQRYEEYVAGLAENGYVVLKPDYRGHGDSEGVASDAYQTSDYTIDVLSAAAALRKLPAVDGERVGMWGHSTGGHLTLRAMVVDPSIGAGVIWGGVVGSYQELIEYWPAEMERHGVEAADGEAGETAAGWRTRLIQRYGRVRENPQAWAAISATSYLQDLSGPVQLHHSRTDEWVPAVLSERLHQRLLGQGQVSELYLYDDDNHNIYYSFDEAMARSVAFFDRHLKTAR